MRKLVPVLVILMIIAIIGLGHSHQQQHARPNIDLAPTLLELAGVPAPMVQGRSLVPLLKGTGGEWRRSFLIEYYSDRVFPRVRQMGYKAVRTERWKYIHYLELDGMDELYDLTADPYEMKNIINQPGARSTLDAMKRELEELLKVE